MDFLNVGLINDIKLVLCHITSLLKLVLCHKTYVIGLIKKTKSQCFGSDGRRLVSLQKNSQSKLKNKI